MKGSVKERWGKLTDDDLTVIRGRRDQLEGKLQERYGYAKSQARKEIEDWYRSTEHHLADAIETIRTDLQSLASSVERIANKQMGRAQVRATEAAHEAEAAITRNPLTAVAIAVRIRISDWCFHAALGAPQICVHGDRRITPDIPGGIIARATRQSRRQPQRNVRPAEVCAAPIFRQRSRKAFRYRR